MLNTLVAIESSYFSVCQHVRVQISNSRASVFALTAFVRHLPHVRPHFYLKTWCVYAREALVTFVCLLTSVCHLVFLQLMYARVCKSYHIALCSKSNGSYDIKDFGTLSLIFSTSKYFRRKFQPCPSFFCIQIFHINEKGSS